MFGVVVAIDPQPFQGPTDFPGTPVLAQRITPSNATTLPPSVASPGWQESVVSEESPHAARPLATSTAPLPLASEPGPAAAPGPQSVPESTTTLPLVAPPPAVVARILRNPVPLFAQPGDAQPELTLSSTTEFGNARVLLATARRGDWFSVLVPVRPNGDELWVRAGDVTLSTVPDLIRIDIASRSLTWTRAGRVELSVPVAVGAPTTPTPLGTFFVTDVVPQSNPSGAYGAWIIALNGHSDAYTRFEGGDPRIAIHGTNDPSSIGQPVSNGCVRVDAGSLDALRAALVPGTPVIVH